jgi:hypothetical protein
MIEPSRIQQQGNAFNANEAFPKVCNTKTEIGKFLEQKYGRYQKVNIYPSAPDINNCRYI